jgi:plastocyanin
MKRLLQPLLSLLISALFTSVLMAATHDVTVNDDFFSPNDLTIQAGDTVRWTNAVGGFNHDVTADNFSFQSTTATSFIYERTFNSVAEILYHCSVHSKPGRNINNNMNGRIVVEANSLAFLINAGLNDAWYNPLTPGQGFFVTVFPDLKQMFLAWFTFDVERPLPEVTAMLGEPGHRWLTAFGSYSGDTAALDVELTQGGVFDSGQPAVSQGPDGTIVVSFSDCETGEITYDIPSVNATGVIPIQRIALDNVAACEALASP